jgi:xanthine dehydrogenase YagR molybdenum-binding subunit
MEVSNRIGHTALDERTSTQVGKPIDRIDGRLKVTGGATYAAEFREAGMAYGVMACATIGKGRIVSIDTAAVERMPGVRLVLTHKNAPPQAKGDDLAPQLTGPDIAYWGQPVALVVAETFEQARAGAKALDVRYQASEGRYDVETVRATARKPPAAQPEQPVDTAVGQFAKGYAESPVKLDVTYTTPDQSHASMEPHAALAQWNGDQLTVHIAHQMLERGAKSLAGTLKMPKDKVRLISPFIGGGFGGKLQICPETVLAAIASKQLGRPVRVVLARQQIFHATNRRSETIQRIRLGAKPDGTLIALGHDSWSDNGEGFDFYEPSTLSTRVLYAAPDRITTHRLATLDKPEAASMRAPGEAVGMLSLENAMDELAHQLDIDPIELRLRNEPKEDPEKHIPFSSRQYVECLQEGAKRFGWDKRNPKPAQVRDGDWWVGIGVAGAARGNLLMPSKARVQLHPGGQVVVQTGMTDIGTGTYTILAQIAADMLGVPLPKVRVELGDTRFPASAGSGGSWGAASAGSSVYEACVQVRDQLAKKAGLNPTKAIASAGRLSDGATSAALDDILGGSTMEAVGEIKPGDNKKTHSQFSYGAHFAEVGVHAVTGEIRVRRMLGVYAAGRILNEKTARSQCIGGMVFGIGTALHEELQVDKRHGQFVNHDLAEYHLPSHADIPDLQVVFMPERDEWANPLKAKGIGELGICGVGAAVTNAVYNACGVRVREYPLTVDKMVTAMAA